MAASGFGVSLGTANASPTCLFSMAVVTRQAPKSWKFRILSLFAATPEWQKGAPPFGRFQHDEERDQSHSRCGNPLRLVGARCIDAEPVAFRVESKGPGAPANLVERAVTTLAAKLIGLAQIAK